MPESVYWIWMQLVFGIGSRRAHLMLETIDSPQELYRQVSAGSIQLEPSEKGRAGSALRRAERQAAEAARKGVELVTPDHPDYPELLDSVYSKPLVLYVKGDLSCLREGLPMAMVGVRKASEYGARVSRELAGNLAGAGCVIVSGLAVGIDSACHIAAMEAGGRTVGVMGCGIDIDYPSGSAPIKTAMKTRGAVISEYPFGFRPDRHTFPPRNRVIAGMCRGTVVVEAGLGSGALITARHALDMGRDVFAVPGSIYSGGYAGSHRLLMDGGAKLVCGARDILEEYPEYLRSVLLMNKSANAGKSIDNGDKPRRLTKGRAPGKPPPENEPEHGPQPVKRQELPEDAPRRLQDVYPYVTENPRTSEVISGHSGVAVGEVMAALTELEILGLVISHPGGFFSIAG